MKILIVGANSAIAENILNHHEYENDEFFLISKSHIPQKQQIISGKAKINFKSKTGLHRLKKIINKFSPKVIIVSMVNYFDDDYVINNKHLDDIYQINYKSIVDIISNNQNPPTIPTIVVFGTISSVIGKKYNVHYASLKRALDSYIESVQASNLNFNVQYYKLGYLDTKANSEIRFFKANLNKLAAVIRKNILCNKNIFVFYPIYWKFLVILIKIIPKKILLRFI
jgi:hypothetical protein